MTLRARLALYLVLVVVLPLTVAVLGARMVLLSDLENRAGDRLGLALRAVSDRADVIRSRAGDVADDLAARGEDFGDALSAGDAPRIQAMVDALAADRERADVVVVVGGDGVWLASVVQPPEAAAGAGPFPSGPELVEAARSGQVGPHLLGLVRPVLARDGGATLGQVLAARWVDASLARTLRGGLTPNISLYADGTLVGSTTGRIDAGSLPNPGATDRVATDGRELLASTMTVGDVLVVASESTTSLDSARSTMNTATLALLAVVVIGGSILSLQLARSVTKPLEVLEEGARALAGGNLDERIDVSGGREVRSVADAFNAMADTLRARLTDLRESHAALTRSLSWMGQTLSSSLDLDRTLVAVIDASVEALRADGGALFMLRPGRQELYIKVARNLDVDPSTVRIPVGSGRAGRVARTGSVLNVPAAEDVATADGEPSAAVAVLVPLRNPQAGEIIGVLSLYRHAGADGFSGSEVRTLRSIASQASVAIENVRLHRATEQASVTDSLTGLWNLRHFEERADEEVERATRFGHPLALLLADLDNFKDVNDRYGHPAGDRVLVEVSRRMSDEVREVDTLARIGGEELVLVLPETSLGGALHTAERIRQRVAATPIDTGSDQVTVTISVGVATFPEHGQTAQALLEAADQAMYAAKAEGRNRVEVVRLPEGTSRT